MNQDYKQLLSQVIKKQIVILGPDITLVKARNVPGLVVADDGTVTDISGNQQQITQQLIDQFVQLSGEIVRKTMEPLLTINSSQQNPSSETPAAQVPVTVQIPTVQTPQIPHPEPALPDASAAQQVINASISSPVSSSTQQPLAQDEKNVQ